MPKQVKQSELAQNPHDQIYQERPIQNYGLSLLQSMGFTKEKGIGRNKQNALDDLLILKPRPRGLGLGAQQQKEPQRPRFSKGNYILITEGTHKDLVGIIIEIKQTTLVVQLMKSHSQVQVTSTNAKLISQSQVNELNKKSREQLQPVKKKRLKWIVPSIKIKVVDKNSPYYLKKMIVTQLISQKQFECLYESQSGNKIVNDLREKDVQTVVPKQGQTVLILKGNYLGQKGKIIQRQKKSQKVIVQTFNELQLITLPEDDISEYVEL